MPSRLYCPATYKKSTRLPKIPCHSETSSRTYTSGGSWESESPMHRAKTYCRLKENGFPRRFAPRDGGIPRFIDLPPSPFRGNDRVFLYIAFSFPYWHSLNPGDPSVACAPAPLRGEPRARNNKHTRPRAPPPSPLSQQSARHKTAAGACIINMRARDAPGHIAYCTIRDAQFIHICTK